VIEAHDLAVAALICAPIGRDASLLVHIAGLESIPCRVHKNLGELAAEVSAATSLVLLSQEAIVWEDVPSLIATLRGQEPWSDLPIILLADSGPSSSPVLSKTLNAISHVGTVSLLERPARVTTIRSALRVAMNARRRQFQMGDLLRKEQESLKEIQRNVEALRKSEEANRLLAAIVNSSEDAIVSKNLDGIITSWNGGAERLFQYSREESVGRSIALVIPPDRLDEEPGSLNRLRRGESVDHFETVRMRKDGSLIDVSLTISPVRDASGRIVGASKVARNITKEKRAERALRESELRLRELASELEEKVKIRTAELTQRNEEVLGQSNELRELSVRLMAAQDQERRFVARELHDSAGQTIAGLSWSLSRIAKVASAEFPPLIEEVKVAEEMIQQLSQEIRTASYLLHPPLLDEAGLESAIRAYIDGLPARGGPTVTLERTGEIGRLPPDVELICFRILQECLTNVVRHSGSKAAIIRMRGDADTLGLEVQDFGRGISPERLGAIQNRGAGVGTRGMRERIKHFGGEMNIESSTSGTTVLVRLPVCHHQPPS
jgi:PAS domain S-box-containing protein